MQAHLLKEPAPDLAALKEEPPIRPPLRAASADDTPPNVYTSSSSEHTSGVCTAGLPCTKRPCWHNANGRCISEGARPCRWRSTVCSFRAGLARISETLKPVQLVLRLTLQLVADDEVLLVNIARVNDNAHNTKSLMLSREIVSAKQWLPFLEALQF